MARRSKTGTVAFVATACAAIGAFCLTVVNETYLKPLGQKLAERWGCLSDVNQCVLNAHSLVTANIWSFLLAAFVIGVGTGLLTASRLRLQGLRLRRKVTRRARLDRHERTLLEAAERAPERRLVVRRTISPPTVTAGNMVFGGASDPGEAAAYLAALDRLNRTGRLRDPWGRGEIYEVVSR